VELGEALGGGEHGHTLGGCRRRATDPSGPVDGCLPEGDTHPDLERTFFPQP
jgi:hypothetical protein